MPAAEDPCAVLRGHHLRIGQIFALYCGALLFVCGLGAMPITIEYAEQVFQQCCSRTDQRVQRYSRSIALHSGQAAVECRPRDAEQGRGRALIVTGAPQGLLDVHALRLLQGRELAVRD